MQTGGGIPAPASGSVVRPVVAVLHFLAGGLEHFVQGVGRLLLRQRGQLVVGLPQQGRIAGLRELPVIFRQDPPALCGQRPVIALDQRLADYKSGLKAKIEKANKDLAEVKYDFKTN